MIVEHLAAHSVAVHPLDLAALSRDELVDLLRQAANATAAGPDWYLARTHPATASSNAILVRVEPMVLDSPREAHCALFWRTMNTTLARHGILRLRALATALDPRPASELSLDELDPRTRTFWRLDARRKRDGARTFLRALAQHLERDLAST